MNIYRILHVKQLETGADAVAMPMREIEIYPKFEVEPFPTFYLRTARAYRFLNTYLMGVLGDDFMQQQKRLLESGQWSTLSLEDELQQMTQLLYGLYVLSSRSVGLNPEKHLLNEELADLGDDVGITGLHLH